MLGNDQLYVLSCLRSSLKKEGAPDDSLIESEQGVIDIILKNGIFLTVYNQLSPGIKEKLDPKYVIAIKQSITQDYEGKRVIQRMREEGVTCIGLKGWETRSLYPKFTMRQMSDIDLLIAPYDFTKVRMVMSELGFRVREKESASKNDTFKKNMVSVETHKRLTESPNPAILEWEKGLLDRSDGYKLTHEDFFIHHMIHMHHDFGNGSLGLRRIADTWLLQKGEMDNHAVNKALSRLNLRNFSDRMVQLSKVCFDVLPMDARSEYLLQHACKYGIFGTEKSYKTARVVTRGTIHKGRVAALKDALFMPYSRMKVLYPDLEKHPGLLPYYWSKRLIGKSHKLRKNIKKMDYSVVTDESYLEMQKFLSIGGYNASVEEAEEG